MIRRTKTLLLPLVASLMVVIGLVAGVSASTGIQLPSWGEQGQQGMTAGPLGLNPAPVDTTTVPVSINIPDASVDAEVERNQIVDGVMLDPSGPWVVSWYQETGMLGEVDNAVMSGHVDYWEVGPAVFYTVAKLPEGALMNVRGENGATFTYAVEWIKTYDVEGLTPEVISEIVGPTDYRALTLITCGGEFNYDTGEYLSRTIIRGKLVDSEGVTAAAATETQAAATETVADLGTNDPAAATETQTPESANQPAQGDLAVGSTATVTEDGLNLRADASTSAGVVTVLAQGQQVTIVGGPVDADGFSWWQVDLGDGTSGWVAADFLSP